MSRDFHNIGRGRFLEAAGFGLAAVTLAGGSPGEALAAGGTAPARAASTPAQALALLKAGNTRFVQGKSTCGSLSARRFELATGQAPFAIVLGCSDSRVPLDTVFDQVPGHLFGVRVAGNFVNDDGLGSIEYGVAVLHAPLIVVLGHGSCGAVDATIKYVQDGTKAPGHIMGLLKAIEPAVRSTKGKPGTWLDNAIASNVRDNVTAMAARSSIIADAVKAKSVEVVGAVYDLESGSVRFH
ncbi:MAG TPA: carbonic anhydrase [Candidatus Tumulicola sp.]|jgi:carbonic anhydrase